MMHRYKLQINGIVQGVGFRPFIYQLAVSLGLVGSVRNTVFGVEIEIQGTTDAVNEFIRQIKTKPPTLAQIVDFSSVEIDSQVPAKGFQILKSSSPSSGETSISPDMAICSDCLKELFDPGDRRFRYPFINCTNCGPRYTIIFDIPYDRQFTSMDNFSMCSDCEREYHDPANRRFHAQPNACRICGPWITLMDKYGVEISTGDPITQCSQLLKEGAIVAVKGLGGFHLMCDADNNKTVLQLRKQKHREEKPLAVMVSSLSAIDSFALYNEYEKNLLLSPQRPIVLLRKNNIRPLADAISPGIKNYGVMLAYAPLHFLLLDCSLRAVVATSGNITEEPIVIDNAEALEKLGNIADYFLVHNRNILVRSDDSVATVLYNKPVILRRSRGYVPAPVVLSEELPQVLGAGSELKNTFCFLRGKNGYISQHIGDMENADAYDFYKETQEHLSNILDFKPSVIAHDMHPDYFTTCYAEEQKDMSLFPVQHHHAHMVSCMAEHSFSKPAIGIILDGTGYGIDRCIWGGEILAGDWLSFRRMGHFEYVPVPGGEKAIKEPWRMALSYLYHTYGEKFLDLSLPITKKRNIREIELIIKMIERNVNCPLTSSCGRLFDGVAAILGIQMYNRYEGQAAMMLEHCLPDNPGTEAYPAGISGNSIPLKISVRQIIENIVHDCQNGISISDISAKFHNTVAKVFTQSALHVKSKTGFDTVVLSGGCFQNAYLLKCVTILCENAGMKVFTHALVPPNDGGISLGQAVVAGANLKHNKP